MLNTIDFRNTSDTGEPEANAIVPITDGEPANQVAFRRPTENTRSRTDVLRKVVREHVVLQDCQAQLLSGGGNVTFDGAYSSYAGKLHLGADLYVLPFATPGGAVAAPYVQSTYATRTIRGADPDVDVLLFTSRYRQWQRPSGGAAPDWAAEADQIAIEIVHTGTLSVAVQGAADKQTNIYITINYGTTTCQEVIDAVAANTDATKLVVVTYTGTGDASTAKSPRFTTSEWGSDYTSRFLRGGAPGLVHKITDDVLNNVSTGFFANTLNLLQKGDTLAIRYDALINLAATGGRLQSTPENLSTEIPATSLFNSRREPENLPNCIPICKCIDNDTVVFVTGAVIQRGWAAPLTFDSIHAQHAGGGSVSVNPSTWLRINEAPCTNIPADTVQKAFNNVDELFEAVLNGTQAFVGTTGNPGVTATGNGTRSGVEAYGGGTSGVGVSGQGGAPNGIGIAGTGDGTGVGVQGTGGHAGGIGVTGVGVGAAAGVYGTGGATNGPGVYGAGTGSGAGVSGAGGTNNGWGVYGLGAGSGYGVSGQGGDTGIGVRGQGGATSGYGVYGKGGATSTVGVKGVGGSPNGDGVEGNGYGTGSSGVVGIGGAGGYGVKGTGGTGGNAGVAGFGTGAYPGVHGTGNGAGTGVQGTGGNTDGTGVYGFGTNGGTGVKGDGGAVSGAGGTFTGGAPNGSGVWAYGDGLGAGGNFTGGDADGPGVVAGGRAGSNGEGVHAQGAGTGVGIHAIGGATGDGVYGVGGSTAGHGVYGLGTGNGAGTRAIGGTTGHGVHASATGVGTLAVYAQATANNAGGVQGDAHGGGTGVTGYGGNAGGTGVYGEATAGNGLGVHGKAHGTGSGVEGYAAAAAGIGVYGQANFASASGVYGESSVGYGVNGISTSGTGVQGLSSSSFGVRGESTSYDGVRGGSATGAGVVGLTVSGIGVRGTNFALDSDESVVINIPLTCGSLRMSESELSTKDWFLDGSLMWHCYSRPAQRGTLSFIFQLPKGCTPFYLWLKWGTGVYYNTGDMYCNMSRMTDIMAGSRTNTSLISGSTYACPFKDRDNGTLGWSVIPLINYNINYTSTATDWMLLNIIGSRDSAEFSVGWVEVVAVQCLLSSPSMYHSGRNAYLS